MSGVLTASTAVTAFVLAAPWLEPRTQVPFIIAAGVAMSVIGTVVMIHAVTGLEAERTAQQQLGQQRAYFQRRIATLRLADTLNATGYDKALAADLQMRAQYGLISHAEARRLRVCLADHVYRRTLARFNALLGIRGIPPIPGRRLNCAGVGF